MYTTLWAFPERLDIKYYSNKHIYGGLNTLEQPGKSVECVIIDKYVIDSARWVASLPCNDQRCRRHASCWGLSCSNSERV